MAKKTDTDRIEKLEADLKKTVIRSEDAERNVRKLIQAVSFLERENNRRKTETSQIMNALKRIANDHKTH